MTTGNGVFAATSSPNAKSNEDTRTPEELLDIIEQKGREVAEALVALRQMSRKQP